MYFDLDGAKINREGQGKCSIDFPDNFDAEKEYPVVIAVHGSNRGAEDYDSCPFYAEQKKIALSYGCVFGVISNKFDTWGTDDGLYNLKCFIDFVTDNYPVRKKVILWATSAGGVLANRFVRQFPERVELVIGTFPVYDLKSTFALQTCRVAWKAKTFEEFAETVEDKNPSHFPEALKKHRYYITHGSADTAVPLEGNSLKMRDELGDNVFLQIIEGGVHSTQNFDFYGQAVKKAFERIV